MTNYSFTSLQLIVDTPTNQKHYLIMKGIHTMARGRTKGQIVEQKPKGYITITNKIRLRVEQDNLTWEEVVGQNKETGELTYGNSHYFTSWNGVLNYLIRRLTTDKAAKFGTVSFVEGKKLILEAIEEAKSLLIGEINVAMRDASDEIVENINKFNR